jgi:hypothetical protein
MQLIAFTEGQRMALASIVGEYIRLAAWQHDHEDLLRFEERGIARLPTTFVSASEQTETSAEELLVKLLDLPAGGGFLFDERTGEYRFRSRHGDLYRLIETGDPGSPLIVSFLERRP